MVPFDQTFHPLHFSTKKLESLLFLQIIINGRAIHVFDEHDVSKIPWELAGVNYVVEATDALNNLNDAKLHLKSKQVVTVLFFEKLIVSRNKVGVRTLD